ncbi:MAG TPA: TIGR03086 family protein, partial [Ornithinibacter sp.]|nr:TIGR03086 family protein [Ornithinibacter sp.]
RRPMALPVDPAERHREVAAGFTNRVRAVEDWDAPSPVAAWRTRDGVRHLVEWFPSFLEHGAGVTLAHGPDADEDPVAAWQVHSDAVQELLDDPGTAGKVLNNRHLGEVPLPEAVDRFYTSDVFMHTWDLARGAGLDDRLDPDACAEMLAGMEPMDEMLRQSGHYGPKVEPPPGADATTRLMAFIGRPV